MTDLFKDSKTGDTGSVACLGVRFESDADRRNHFIGLLREKLKDLDFRNQSGFPVASDEAILEMSDPPYFTACPNPWLTDFVTLHGRRYDPNSEYSREPMAVDVSFGKSDPLYQAHAYHTKVPHLAIVPSILHFTRPGDVVLDGFAGSGMTGIAAQWCGVAPASFRHEIEDAWRKDGRAKPEWGHRRAILNDLSPAATYISANQNIPFSVADFRAAAQKLLAQLEEEIGWMYETLHTDGKTKGRIDYTVWGEIFSCPECVHEIDFIQEAFDEDQNVKSEFDCPECGVALKKDRLDRVFEVRMDPATGQTWERIKFRPALIRYSVGKSKFDKKPDAEDLRNLDAISAMALPSGIPTDRFPIEDMYHGSRIAPKGFTNVHHFFLPRAQHALARMWELASAHDNVRLRHILIYFVEQAIWTSSILNRFQPQGFKQVNKYLPGVYYVPSKHCEVSPWYAIGSRGDRIARIFSKFQAKAEHAIITTGTAENLQVPDNSIDYIFTDPPFGENIFYADLNYLVESWHRVKTASRAEAIVDKHKGKGLLEYQRLMQSCFHEYFRVLKPGRWMTVVFSNSKAAVWNAIQVALQQAGFVVAEVNALDKVLGSYRQVTSTTAVKQDLVISAYKPNGGLESRLSESGAAPDSAWDFVQTHLRQLPISKMKSGILEMVVERDPRRVYDRMVAWFVRHDFLVPLSTEEFLEGLRNRYSERDGMVFLPEQVAEYDRKRAQAAQAPQMELFVSDERSAIDWLTDFLRKRPSTYQEVHPEFTTQLGAGWKKHETRPELSELLEDNFLRYDGSAEVPSQIHTYLSSNFHDLRNLEKSDERLKAKAKDRWFMPDPNKAQDLEKKREKALLKEYQEYRNTPGRKLKEFRLEVVRAGFKAAWANKDYQAIVSMANKVPEEALQEDEKLLFWYDSALTRTGG